MNWLYGGIAGVLLLGLYTWGVFEWGKDSCEAKVITLTVYEEKRQAEGVGQLKVGDIKHEQRVKNIIREAAAVAAPQDCDRADIGDLRVNALGGVRSAVRDGADRSAAGRGNP